MPKENRSEFGLSLDRRQLLTTAAAVVTVAGIVPTRPTEIATPPAAAINLAPVQVSDASALNAYASTARRIEEIIARNRIRAEACLPLLSIPKELRRMKEAADTAEFEAFAAINRQSVLEEVLAPMREAKEQPNWRPIGWMEGLGFETRDSKILHERFIAQQHF